MWEYHVNNFKELHEVLERFRKDNRWLFRGHSDPDWQLVPKAYRKEFAGCDDEGIFRAWKRRAVEFISLPFEDDWGWLAIAQHHGLATRLLDWTFNPLAAAFFAVTESANTNAALFVYVCTNNIEPADSNPFKIKSVAKFKPMGVAPRIIRQGGLFTIHGEPDWTLEKIVGDSGLLHKIIIDSSYRNELLHELSYYGVNKATLFPDLDGLSAHINWITANRQYWSLLSEEDKDLLTGFS